MTEPLSLSEPWRRLFPTPLILVLALWALLTALRAYGSLGSELFESQPVTLSFVLMLLVPMLFLSQHGRLQIGLGQPLSFKRICAGMLVGGSLAALCFGLSLLLFGKGDGNGFASIAYSYQSDPRMAQLPQHLAFVAMTLPAILASPLGEEFFFRGVVEQANRERLRPFARSCLAAALFATAQLLHHGIYRGHDGLGFLPASASLWFALMFGTGLAFSFVRREGGSIWVAVAAHATFNLVANIGIFYALLVVQPQTLAAN